jgi:hypothetical protein
MTSISLYNTNRITQLSEIKINDELFLENVDLLEPNTKLFILNKIVRIVVRLMPRRTVLDPERVAIVIKRNSAIKFKFASLRVLCPLKNELNINPNINKIKYPNPSALVNVPGGRTNPPEVNTLAPSSQLVLFMKESGGETTWINTTGN